MTQIRNYIYHFILWCQGWRVEKGSRPGCKDEKCVLKEYKGLQSKVIIPKGVTSIGDSAFAGCTGLTKVVIPKGVISIEEAGFSRCTSKIMYNKKQD